MFASLTTITPNRQFNFGHVVSILLASNIRHAKDFSCTLCTSVIIDFVGKTEATEENGHGRETGESIGNRC
jgi:hypothetical protein